MFSSSLHAYVHWICMCRRASIQKKIDDQSWRFQTNHWKAHTQREERSSDTWKAFVILGFSSCLFWYFYPTASHEKQLFGTGFCGYSKSQANNGPLLCKHSSSQQAIKNIVQHVWSWATGPPPANYSVHEQMCLKINMLSLHLRL